MTFDVGDLVRPTENIWQSIRRNTIYRVYRVNDFGGIYIETLDGLAIDHPHGKIWSVVFFKLYVPVNDQFSLGELI